MQKKLSFTPGENGSFAGYNDKDVKLTEHVKGSLGVAFPEKNEEIPQDITATYQAVLDARTAGPTKVFHVPNCNHQFHGETNERYLSALSI